MGRKHYYHKDLHQQAYDALISRLALGESKYHAKLDGTACEKIFSVSTYRTYWRHIKGFLNYVKETHPECRKLKHAKKYVHEWLQGLVDLDKYSAHTISLKRAALCKLFQIRPDDPNYFIAPVRHRRDIKRSRYPVKMDSCFSVENNDILIRFATATGGRRAALGQLTGDDLWTYERIQLEAARLENIPALSKAEKHHMCALTDALTYFPDQKIFVHFRRDKGGRSRFAPVIGADIDLVVKKMQSVNPDERVWEKIHGAADIHSYRAEYAASVYKLYAREISDIPYDRVNRGSGHRYQSDVYTARGDAKGIKLDKAAMLRCSKALGHNRIDVVATSYLWTL